MARGYTVADSPMAVTAAGLAAGEETLRRRWQEGQVGELVTRQGVRLGVVYRGRSNRGAGPDFRDVVLATEAAELWQGDLEVDQLSSLWWAHGHHRDAAYNGVVLHLVGRDDARWPPRRQDGQAVAVACLQPGWPEEARRAVPVECRLPAEETGGPILDLLGEKRFGDKVARFEAALSQQAPSEVLYQGLMEALGYPENREAFGRLAQSLPLTVVEGFLWGKSTERAVEWAEALLLGAGGLLTPASPLAGLWGAAALFREEAIRWRWAGGRPLNHPARRLRGMARLLGGLRQRGLLGALAEAVETGQPRVVEAALMVAGEGGPAFIGRERAREMVINVALPFFVALAEPGCARDKATALFAVYPPGASNVLLRQMVGQLGGEVKPLLTSARRQQGLLHLYRRFCTQGRCPQCPWGEPIQRSQEGPGQ